MDRVTADDYVEYINERYWASSGSFKLDGYNIIVEGKTITISADNAYLTIDYISSDYYYFISRLTVNGKEADVYTPVSKLLGRISPVKNARLN